MNRKIPTSLAIIIIIVLAVLVAGIIFWQYLGISKEEKIPELISQKITPKDGETKQDDIIKSCESNSLEKDLGKENVIYLNFDGDNDKEILVGWPAIKAVDPHYFYVLDKQSKSCYIVWQRNTYDDFNIRSVANLSAEDLDKNGIDEIIISGSNWGGTCTGGANYNYIYSPKLDKLFIGSKYMDMKGQSISGEGIFCTEKERKKGEGCDGSDLVTTICFSNNLKEEKYQVFKKYLDNILAK